MATKILDRISTPADLASLNRAELDRLAFELRAEMVAATSLHGGHLAPSLGAVEIILALHRVLNCPEDKIVFDVGHQAYAHKLLTGRRDQFNTLRTFGGIAGFPKASESEYDAHAAGHASDALSTAMGYAMARDIRGTDETIAVVVGDAAFTGGMSMEALNLIGQSKTKMIIVLNDNGMSISRNVGAFAEQLGKARMSDAYTTLRDSVQDAMESTGKVGKFLVDTGKVMKESFKQLVLPTGTIFEAIDITYVGPIDGHDMAAMERIFENAKNTDGPVVVHAITTKGKGYKPAEEHPEKFHGVSAFDISTGKPHVKNGAPSWTSVFSDELMKIASENEDVVAITAAMESGTGLEVFHDKYPERFFDVGIAEEHAVTFASALALAGKTPVVAIYSTFLQRAYDQMMINVALQKQHVVFCLDRAGLVGEDGATHHGMFDLTYMRSIPGMKILSPSDAQELRSALRTAIAMEGPVAIRYPRGSAPEGQDDSLELWEEGKARKLCDGKDAAILAIGSMVGVAKQAIEALAERGYSIALYDMRWAKPIDAEAVAEAAKTNRIVTLEENTVVGGFGSAVLESLADQGILVPVERIGLPDEFVTHGAPAVLHEQMKIDAAGVEQRILEALQR